MAGYPVYQRALIGACYEGSLPLALAAALSNAPPDGDIRLMRKAFVAACGAGRMRVAQYLWEYSDGLDPKLFEVAGEAFTAAMPQFFEGTLEWLLSVAGDAIAQAESANPLSREVVVWGLGCMGGPSAFASAETVSPLAALLLQRLHWSKPRAAWISAVLRAKRA